MPASIRRCSSHRQKSALFAALGVAEADMQAPHEDLEQDYKAKCLTLAALQSTIDAYFDEVMVMAEEPAIRANRLATLQKMRTLFLDIADLLVASMSVGAKPVGEELSRG